MRGIVLAGGNGKRLGLLALVVNKHLLPIGDKPMILHPITKLVEADIRDIMVITGRQHMGAMMELLGSGKDYGCRLTYRAQDEAGGIAEALGLCEDFARGDKIVVVLGDNIFTTPLGKYVEYFQNPNHDKGAMILVTESNTPSRFGVVEMDDAGNILSIEEKPPSPRSTWVQTGIYFYNNSVFRVIKGLRPSERGELEITDVHNHYIRTGENIEARRLDGQWTDAGTIESLAGANRMISNE